MKHSYHKFGAAAAFAIASIFHPAAAQADEKELHLKHVLIITVDGLHAFDVGNFINENPTSNVAQLAGAGVVYTQASCPKPANSFPGLLALVTGGTPAVTGVYYDVSYDHLLLPPGSSAVPGTAVVYDGSVDKDSTRLDAGGGIDPTKLPRDPVTLQPVYPHQYLRVNTVFELAKARHLHTAWIDQHPSDEIVNGPSGTGVDDLYTPEISANDADGIPIESSVDAAMAYDDSKVAALINQIHGLDSTGLHRTRVPAIFGLNFEAVNVAQKMNVNVNQDGTSVTDPTMVHGGYLNAVGVPTPLVESVGLHTDASLGLILAALKETKLFNSTLIIVTAEHGQGPVDPTRFLTNSTTTVATAIAPVPVAFIAQDGAAYVWLQNHAATPVAGSKLVAQQQALHLQDVVFGPTLQVLFPAASLDSRVPDIAVIPNNGCLFEDGTSRIEGHGGFSVQETNVGLIVANPQLTPGFTEAPVSTAQVAPTILKALGLNPNDLEAVKMQGTQVLPLIFNNEDDGK